MSRSDRFRVKATIADALIDWDFDRQNLLLEEFGLEGIDPSWSGSTLAHAVKDATDDQLVEMYGVVFGVDPSEVADTVASTFSDGNWKPGYLRLFISHSAHHKAFAAEVAAHLAVVGIHGFVAHDTMQVTRPWQSQIESHLRSMQAFVVLVHPEVNASAWCHQEIGWALGRRTPQFIIRFGCDPVGFVGRDQWPSCDPDDTRTAADLIIRWASSNGDLGEPMFDRLLAALRDTGNFVDAGAAAEQMAALGTLTDEQFVRLDEVWLENDQLHGGILPTRAIRPLYDASGRPFPPTNPAPISATEDPF